MTPPTPAETFACFEADAEHTLTTKPVVLQAPDEDEDGWAYAVGCTLRGDSYAVVAAGRTHEDGGTSTRYTYLAPDQAEHVYALSLGVSKPPTTD